MRHRQTSWLGFVLVSTSLLFGGCASKGPAKPGMILVGSPQVLTRERLLNDRLEQEKWLKDQLTASDSASFGFQGATDIRSFAGTSIGLGINSNPLEQQAYRQESADYMAALERQRAAAKRQEEIARLDHEIELEKKRQALDKARSETMESLSSASESGAAEGGEGEGAEAEAELERPEPPDEATVPDTSNFLTGLIKEGRDKLLPSAANIAVAEKVTASPVDKFRDQLAFREEIRAEMLENSLDDRHDIDGSTVYRLTFAATVLPAEGVRDWAAVNAKIVAVENPDTLFDDWKREFEKSLKFRYLKHLLQFESCGKEGVSCTLPDDLAIRLVLLSSCPHVDLNIMELMEEAQNGDGAGILQPIEGVDSPAENPGGFDFDMQDFEVHLRTVGREIVKRELLEGDIKTLAKCLTVDGRKTALSAALRQLEVEETELKNYVEFSKKEDPADFSLADVKPSDPKEALGSAKFKEKINEASQKLFAYSVTPKESVQRISEVEGSRRTIELAASLGLMTGQASVKAAVGYIKETQKLLQGIRRQPLVVGYIGDAGGGQYPATSEARVGWLIGPKFDSQKLMSKAPRFSQVPIQNSLSAVIGAPSWARKIKVTIEPAWLDPTNLNRTTVPDGNFKSDYEIALPGDLLNITDLLRIDRVPRVYESLNFSRVKGQPVRVLISGTNLWRGAAVTIGGQPADKIRILSEREGIVATFDALSEPVGKNIPVRVWTSTGVVNAGLVNILEEEPKEEKEEEPELAIKAIDTHLIAGADERISLKVTSGKTPKFFADAKIGLRPAGKPEIEWTYTSATVEEKLISAPLPAALKTPMPGKGPNAQKVDVTLLIQARKEPSRDDILLTAKEKPVFYPRPSAAKVAVSPRVVKRGNNLVLRFPPLAVAAFPSLTASTHILLHKGSVLADNVTWTVDTDGEEWVFTGTLPKNQAEGIYEISFEPEIPGLELSQATITVAK